MSPAQKRSATPSRWRARVLLVAGGGLVALLLAEVAARLIRALTREQTLASSQQRAGADATIAPGTTVRLGHMIRAARNKDVVYELVPGLDVQFKDVRVVTNADGFRGPQRTHAKPARGFRIVGLGDSVLFGWGVPYEASGLAVLETLAQEVCPARVVETVNTGVPGYNTAMQANVLRDKGLAFGPDVVLVDFVGNDLDLPNILWDQPDWWALDRSFLVDLAYRAFSWRDADLHGPFVHAPRAGVDRFVGSGARVPPAYRHLVGLDAYRNALQAITAMAKQHGFRALVTCHHDLPADVLAICRELDVPCMQLGTRIGAWMRDNNCTEYLGSPLSISTSDPHPTAIVHRIWAEGTLAQLRELGWLPH